MRMATSPDVARARFAQFVERSLRAARDRGMTDLDIKKATGIPPSTFHRWQSGAGGLPQPVKIRAFCEGLGIPLSVAARAMGLDDLREPTPEPPLDPDVALIARRLNDPSVTEAEKTAIRHMLRLLSGRGPAEQASRAQPSG